MNLIDGYVMFGMWRTCRGDINVLASFISVKFCEKTFSDDYLIPHSLLWWKWFCLRFMTVGIISFFLVRNPEFSPANNWIFKWEPSQEKEFYLEINHFVYWHWINKNNMNCAYPSRVGLVISFWNIHKIWLVQISEFQLLNKPKRKE